MKVFLAGATGMVGRPALAALVADGHAVTAVARSEEKAALARRMGSAPIKVDLFDAAAVRAAVAGHDVVINLATHIPPLAKMMLPGAWEQNNRIRSEVSRNLVDAALAARAQRYIQESIAFIYRDGGDAWLDEDSDVDLAPYVMSVNDAEGNAKRFADAGGAGVVLRFGLFHGPQSDQTQAMLRSARQSGVAMMLGAPDGYVPFIHTDDAGSAVAAAVRAPSGVYNVVDDEPLTRREYAAALARALDKRAVRLPPRALAKVGGSKGEMLARSQRVSNTRFRTATGWTPSFASAREGLPAIIREGPPPVARSATTIARVLLALMAATSFLLAVWPLLSPHGFYASFPGGGRHWVSVDGPYNEHFIRDFGAFNLAFAVVAGWAAAKFTVQLARVAAVAALAFAIPHLAYHAAHLTPLTATSDKVANMVSLGFGVLLPAAVLIASFRISPVLTKPRRGGSGSGSEGTVLDVAALTGEAKSAVGAR